MANKILLHYETIFSGGPDKIRTVLCDLEPLDPVEVLCE